MWEAQCFVCACVYPWRKVCLCSVYTPFLLPSPLFSFLHPPAPPITHPVSSWPNQQHSRDQDCLQQRRFVAANLKCQEYISWVESWSQRNYSVGVCSYMWWPAVWLSLYRGCGDREAFYLTEISGQTQVYFPVPTPSPQLLFLSASSTEKGGEGEGRRGRREEREKRGRFMLTCNQW